MGHCEKEYVTKSAIKRPLVVADLVEYRGYQFLVAFLYSNSYVIAQIIVPTREYMKNGISIADKLKEIVSVNCNEYAKIPFDLYTCNETIFGVTLKDPYIMTQLKPQADCSECTSVMYNDKVREALDDLYIREYQDEIREAQKEERSGQRSIRNAIRRAFEYVRQKAANFIDWLRV
ncbi:hypothetical protein [Bacillus nitratireducens]|uniref:hypothetical protein n=1 Tax=Bacillus nitratireducens TaxID=2026193 RepID=UPI002E1C3F59|nr:hypothetical protein [Bacillus nitratireducens]